MIFLTKIVWLGLAILHPIGVYWYNIDSVFYGLNKNRLILYQK
jgi:hypothetical protein